MFLAKLAAASALTAVVLAGCGTSAKPVAGSGAGRSPDAGHARLDDPRTQHIPCLRAHHLQLTEFGQNGIQIGPAATGPTVRFAPTPGAAQDLQIRNQVAGAEVIGAALLFPNQASDSELQVIEDCLTNGVTG
jgi:hypothetical protein